MCQAKLSQSKWENHLSVRSNTPSRGQKHDTLRKQKPRQPTNSLPPLLPLQYCRTERAAELLNCKVEDLLHWAAIGVIRLYVMAHRADYSIQCRVQVISPEPDVTACMLLQHGAYYHFGESRPGLWMSSIRMMLEQGIIDRYDFSRPEPQCRTDNIQEGVSVPDEAILGGFWAVNRQHFMLLEQYGDPLWGELSGYLLLANDSDGHHPVKALNVQFPSIMNHLWVMREDLERLHQCIGTGMPFDLNKVEPIVSSPLLGYPVDDLANYPSKVRFAAEREVILAAALRAHKLWPKECRSAKAWAAALVDHSYKLFERDAPCSLEHMTCIIDYAMNGKIFEDDPLDWKAVPVLDYAPNSQYPHPNSMHNAVKHERVLVAAIRSLTLWPEECQTALNWSFALANHWSELAGSEPQPYSQEQMMRIISRARNKGTPYRKT